MSGLLKIELDDVTVSRSGSVHGPIYFCFDGHYFPEKGWWDFPLVILSWWLDELASNVTTPKLDFMDGPCELHAVRVADKFQLTGVWNRLSQRDVVFSEFVPRAILVSSIQDEAMALLSHLKEVCPDNPDFIELRSKMTGTI